MKAFNVRITHRLWHALKKKSADIEISMNDIVIDCLENFLNKDKPKKKKVAKK